MQEPSHHTHAALARSFNNRNLSLLLTDFLSSDNGGSGGNSNGDDDVVNVLHAYARDGYVKGVKMYLDRHRDHLSDVLNHNHNPNKQTPLHVALERYVRVRVRDMVSPHQDRSTPIYVHAHAQSDWPLPFSTHTQTHTFGAYSKEYEVCKYLVERGASLEVRDIIGRTPFLYAVR